ncbi:hypothetical protein COX58_02105 [archaeon CG_4_10_14_0_2_um_filter_Archaea_38_6]|nr:MAG: hypothetical protein COX58_02105 [archaeon CG_4_10_14_0_2_um_filter_Archaea_38_6]
MSAKDLCCLPFLEKLKKAGISSFKIEGRNRSPEYVYAVVSIYRKALDKRLTKKELKESVKNLEEVYNRGFSSGFYFKIPTSDDFTKTEHGESKKTKMFIGKIHHYWKNIGVADLKINTGKLKIGDVIIVSGNTTFFKTKIESMEIDHKPISSVKKGKHVGIKLPECRENDEVYLVVKK